MIIRMFDTAVDPEDVERGKEIFRSSVKPVFDGLKGCHGIELMLGLEEHSGGLVDVAAIARWDSQKAIEAAMETREYQTALEELKALFQQTPIVRHFEVIE
ncbi:MAG: antibiotic biosynthesis monooxygenase family protein [Actinomycetota bacterium]